MQHNNQQVLLSDGSWLMFHLIDVSDLVNMHTILTIIIIHFGLQSALTGKARIQSTITEDDKITCMKRLK